MLILCKIQLNGNVKDKRDLKYLIKSVLIVKLNGYHILIYQAWGISYKFYDVVNYNNFINFIAHILIIFNRLCSFNFLILKLFY